MNVDLPLPLAPMMATNSPRLMQAHPAQGVHAGFAQFVILVYVLNQDEAVFRDPAWLWSSHADCGGRCHVESFIYASALL